MKQALNQARQDAAVVREFVDAFEGNFKYAERVWTANPDLRERMHRANTERLDAEYVAAGGINALLMEDA